VVANAGYGKTTLLTQAVAENALDPFGDDVWLSLHPRDRAAAHFLAGLVDAFGADEVDSGQVDVDDIIDLFVLRAPRSVALFLDDVHVLVDSPSMDLLVELAQALPANGHLVLGSRVMPPLGLRRMQLAGTANVLSQADLAFTEADLEAVAALPGMAATDGAPANLPTWPALAALSASMGREASIEYVWDEVLADFTPERRSALALASLFDTIDDDLVTAVTGPEWSAATVVDGLPLVTSDGGRHRLHDLWREALAPEVDPDDRRRALLAGAEALEARGDLVSAAQAYADAGSEADLVRVVRDFASQPLSAGLDRASADALSDLLPPALRDGAISACLRVIDRWIGGGHDLTLERLEAATRSEDPDIAALAWWRLVQGQGDAGPPPAVVPDALVALAEDGPAMARCALALAQSHVAQSLGDIRGAIEALEPLDLLDRAIRKPARAGRLMALGQPEQVDTSLAEVLESGVRDPNLGQAVWQRGEIDPDVAWPIARTLPASYGKRRLPGVQSPLLGIVSAIGLAVGAVTEARALAEESRAMGATLTPRLALFGGIADAVATLVAEGEESGVALLSALRAEVPLEPWPAWAYLSALAPIRALLPGTDWLDDLPFGPSLALAVRAGAAIRALRDDQELDSAADLPWGNATLLRVHVPAPLLVELAVAALAHRDAPVSSGAPSSPAGIALRSIPDHGRLLQRLADHPDPRVRRTATSLAAVSSTRPDHDLHLVTLGGLRVVRSDGVEVEPLSGRNRLGQLLAQLILRRSVTRSTLAAAMWPDLEPDQAANNLRVTLHKLLAILEPDRGSASAWWIRADGDQLHLCLEGLTIDVDEFDHHLTEARTAERHGSPSTADAHYAAAADLYGGEFMPGSTDIDVESERERLTSLAHSALSRRAELLLARGEPEAALAVAVSASRIDPLGERAHRTAISCYLALGARSTAARAADQVLHLLADHGLAPEPETVSLLARLG
jgi:DNA-binding SARP family transcriptional activator